MFNTPFTFLKAATAAADADATAYLAAVVAAGGTVDATITSATNTLFTDLKTNSLYTKMKAFYPVLGGIAASNLINGNLNASFNLTFNGTFTQSSSGFSSTSSSSYAATNYLPLTEHPGGNMTMGCFINTTATANDRYVMAVYETGAKAIGWGYGPISIDGYFTAYGGGLSYTPSSFIGFIQVGGDATTRYITQNINGVDTNLSAARNGSGLPNLQIYLSNLNFAGSPYSQQSGRVCFAYMSDFLSQAEMNTMASIVNTFQTTLGRNYF